MAFNIPNIVCIFVLFTGFVICEDATVTTKVGTFVGYIDNIKQLDGSTTQVTKYFGIPYAEAPVGDLRFRKTVPKGPIADPMETKVHGSACLYVNFVGASDLVGSEDCLFLNVYVPERGSDVTSLPVMVWLHGGGFVFGTSKSHQCDRLAASGPVIVVTLNYRLSVWGFLSTDDDEAPGNYGLWDQHTAIKWVHDNIEAFGGDPNRVTLFGESAGGASVVYQGLFPGNKGLFQRLIAQSGSAAGSWAEMANSKADAAQFAGIVGCESDSSKEMLACLRDLPTDLIDATMNNFSNGLLRFPLPYVPNADGIFVETSPSKIFDLGQNLAKEARDAFTSFDLLTGINSEEGLVSINQMAGVAEPDNFLPAGAKFREMIKTLMTYQYGTSPSDLIVDAVVAEYTPWDDPENSLLLRQNLVAMDGDMYFLEPLYRTLALHTSATERQSFMYYLDIKPSKHFLPTVNWSTGANHADDLIFLFGEEPGTTSEKSESHAREMEQWERDIAADIMTLWTNFAATGNPNKPRDLGIDWLPYTPKYRHFMELKNPVGVSKVKNRVFDRRMNFFMNILPKLRNLANPKKTQKKPDAEGTCSKDGDCPP